MEQCATCRWFDDKVTTRPSEKADGYCRRRSAVCGGTSEYAYTTWPNVYRVDWCGEYKERNDNAD